MKHGEGSTTIPKGSRLINNRNNKYLMAYIVYITINLCNGKFYIGVHRTNPDIFDGYIGDGIYRQQQANKPLPFHKAVKKYGYENFRRTTIKIFPDTEEGKKQAFALEAILVNTTLLKSKFVYNACLGGNYQQSTASYKKVYKFDLNGNYIATYACSRDAAASIDVENIESVRQAIKNNCQGTSTSSHGFFWSYKKEFIPPKNNGKIIAQYTASGKFLRTYNSITEAEIELGLTSILQAISKNYLCGGYQWRYYENNDNNIPPLVNNHTKNSLVPIIMYDKKLNVVSEFNSVEDCVKTYPELSKSQINRVLKGIIKTHKGFTFKIKIQSDLCGDVQLT